MSCDAKFTDDLRKRGYRITPQRRVILHILSHANEHLTPSEVFEQTKESLPGLTETTVYRTLEFLRQVGLAQAGYSKNGKRSYEMSDHAHHHLVCRACGYEMEIPHARLAGLFTELEESTDFELAQNHITIFGLCSHCKS